MSFPVATNGIRPKPGALGGPCRKYDINLQLALRFLRCAHAVAVFLSYACLARPAPAEQAYGYQSTARCSASGLNQVMQRALDTVLGQGRSGQDSLVATALVLCLVRLIVALVLPPVVYGTLAQLLLYGARLTPWAWHAVTKGFTAELVRCLPVVDILCFLATPDTHVVVEALIGVINLTGVTLLIHHCACRHAPFGPNMRTQLPRQALALAACLSLAQAGRRRQRALAPTPSAAAATAAPSEAAGSGRPRKRHLWATLPFLRLLFHVFRMTIAGAASAGRRMGLAAADPDPVRQVYGKRPQGGSQVEEREQGRQEQGQAQGHERRGASQWRPAIVEGCEATGPRSGFGEANCDTSGRYPLCPCGPITQATTAGADGSGRGEAADGADGAAPAFACPDTCVPFHAAGDCDSRHANDDACLPHALPSEPACQQLHANQAVSPWGHRRACAAVAARGGGTCTSLLATADRPGQLERPSVAQQADGPSGPGPVPLPPYEPFIRHRIYFSKIPGYELSQVTPGYEQRLALLVQALQGHQGAGGGGGSGGRRRLGSVYLRSGCIEVLLEEEEWGSGSGSGIGDSEDGVSIAERSASGGSWRVATSSECGADTCPLPFVDEDTPAQAPAMVAATAEEGQQEAEAEGPDGWQVLPLRSGCGYGTTVPSSLDCRRSCDSVGAERGCSGSGLGSSGGGGAGAPGSAAVLFSGRLIGRSTSSLRATTRIHSSGRRCDDQHPGGRNAGAELDVAGIIGALLQQQSSQGEPTPAGAATAAQPGATATAQGASSAQRPSCPSPPPLTRQISDAAAAAAAAAVSSSSASTAGAAMGGTEVPEPRPQGPSRRARGIGRRGRTLTDGGLGASASAVSRPAARNSSGGGGGSGRSVSDAGTVGDVLSDNGFLLGAIGVQPRVLLLPARPPQPPPPPPRCGAPRDTEPSSPPRAAAVAAASGAGTGGGAPASSHAATAAAAAAGGSSVALAVLRVTIPRRELLAGTLIRQADDLEVLVRARSSYLRAGITTQAVHTGAVAGRGGAGGESVRRTSDPGGGDVGQAPGGMGGDQQQCERRLASLGGRVMLLIELELLELPSEPGLVMVDFRWRGRPCCVVPLLLTADPAVAAELQLAVACWSRPLTELDELLLDLGTWEFHVAAVAAGAAPAAAVAIASPAAGGGAAAAEAALDAGAAPRSQAAAGGAATRPRPSTRLAPSNPPRTTLPAGPAVAALPAPVPPSDSTPPQHPAPQPPLLDSCTAELLPALGQHLLCYAQACGWRRLAARLQSDLARLAAATGPSAPQAGGGAAGADCVAQHPDVVVAGGGASPSSPAAGAAAAAATGPQPRHPAAAMAPAPVAVTRRAVPRTSEAGRDAVGKAPAEGPGQGTPQMVVAAADERAGGTRGAAPADDGVGGAAVCDGGVCVSGYGHGGACSGAGRAAAVPAPAAVGPYGLRAPWSFLRRRSFPRQRPDWMQALLLVLGLRPVPRVEEEAFRQYADPWVLAQGLAIRWVEFVSLVATLCRCARDGLLLTSGPVMLFMAFGVGTLSLAARRVLPYNTWVRLERASRLPRYLGYMAAKASIVVLRLPPPPGVAPYLMTPGMLALEGLILPGSCLLPARTALLVIPLLNAITGFELLVVRATNSVATAVLVAGRTAVMGIATNLACHTYMRMCFDSRRRGVMGAGLGQGSMGAALAKDSQGRLGGLIA